MLCQTEAARHRGPERKGCQQEPFADGEPNQPQDYKTNSDQKSGELRVHLQYAHRTQMAIHFTVLHHPNCPTPYAEFQA